MFHWNSVAPYQCMLSELRGQKVPIVYHQGKLHMIIPNSEHEPYIKGQDQGLIISSLLEGVKWNDINCSMTTQLSFDDQFVWDCTLSKDGKTASATSKNLYIALSLSYAEIFRLCNLAPSDTDPVVKANFSVPPD